jgi:hypothetical protein
MEAAGVQVATIEVDVTVTVVPPPPLTVCVVVCRDVCVVISVVV